MPPRVSLPRLVSLPVSSLSQASTNFATQNCGRDSISPLRWPCAPSVRLWKYSASDKSRCPVFKSYGAVTYDERILSFKGLDRVSLWASAVA